RSFVPAVRPLSVYEVVFAPTVARAVKFVPSVDRSTTKPVSSDDLSAQLNFTAVGDAATAVSPAGAAGTVGAGTGWPEYRHDVGMTSFAWVRLDHDSDTVAPPVRS